MARFGIRWATLSLVSDIVRGRACSDGGAHWGVLFLVHGKGQTMVSQILRVFDLYVVHLLPLCASL